MRILIRTAAGLPPDLAQKARRRLEFALGRFDDRLRSVTARLSDASGPRGRVEKQVLVTVVIDAPSERPIVIEDADPVASDAVDRAADRAARAVARALHALADRRAIGWRS